MAWTFVGAGTAVSATNTDVTPLSVSWPSHLTGDIAFLCCRVRNQGATINTPSGWTLKAQSDAHANHVIFTRTAASGSESAVDVTTTSGTRLMAVIVVFRGGTETVNGTPDGNISASTANLPYDGITPSVDNCLVLYFGSKNLQWTSVASIPNFTDAVDAGLANEVSLSVQYWIQTTATGISDAQTLAVTGDATGSTDSVMVAFEPASNPAPDFDTSPTVQSQTASAYTIAYDADANATDIWVGAYPKDATAPTAAQLKAGTGAHGTATEATTGSADTIVLTPTDNPAFPLYDIYAVLEGAGGFSSVVALTDEFLDAPAGKQFMTLASVSGTSPLTGESPAVVAGDIWVLDTVTIEDGYAITPTDTGDYTMDRGGDTSRQSFEHDVYDVSLAAYYGEGTVYDGNQPPQFVGGAPFFNGTVYKKDEDQGTIDISTAWSDVEGDSITFDVSAGTLPTGWNLAVNGQITGTPTVYGTYTPTFRGTDSPPGDSSTSADSVVIGDEAPNVVGMLPASATTTIEGVANFTVFSPSLEDYSDDVPAGRISEQSPAAGTYVADDTIFTLTISLGPEDSGTGGLVTRKRRKYLVQIDNRTFSVDTPQQAVQMLQEAKAIAQEHAQAIARKAVQGKRKVGKKPVKLPTPKISSPNPELKEAVSETRKEINAIYRNASRDAELAYLMQRQAEDDEEESLLLLM